MNKSRVKALIVDIIGLESAVAWININSLWSLVKGPLSIYFLVKYLTPQQQGIWYTFGSLSALTTFAELGFTLIISQFVSHEYAKLELRNNALQGSQFDLDRIVSLIRYALKFYSLVVPSAAIGLAVFGFIYFNKESANILTAWLLYSIVGGLNLFVTLLYSIYRGLDRVAVIQRNLFISTIILTFVNWLLLYLGFQIWSLAISGLVGIIISIFLLYRISGSFWLQIFKHQIIHKFKWFKEIIVLQSKYAITFASGYMIFYLYVPTVYKFQGQIAAGQLGMTLALIQALQGFSSAWLTSRGPQINILVANNDRVKLYRLILRSTIISCTIFIIGASAIILFIYFLSFYEKYSIRFLSLPVLVLILLYQFVPTMLSSISTYLRAHKKEPHLALSIVISILVVGSLFIILPHYGLFGLMISINIIFWLISIPWILWLFYKYKRIYG